MIKRRKGQSSTFPQRSLPQLQRADVVYKNQYQRICRVRADFGEFTREYFVSDTGQRAGIVVVKGDSVLLVRQYRLLLNGSSWEIPAGAVDHGETPEQAAVRECLEETGVRCVNPRPVIFYHVGLDTVYNPTFVFYSSRVAQEHETQGIHRQEVRDSKWVPLVRCMKMIFQGRIVDSFSIVALLAYQARFGMGAIVMRKVRSRPPGRTQPWVEEDAGACRRTWQWRTTSPGSLRPSFGA